ncbi:MAG: hypothetical protein IT320_23630 [Anaerolineae bacterium]|nr:hypothetical protein [Anaerolineae bacterium]
MDRVDITLTLNLPQDLVDEAKSAGLLTDEQIERWLTDELDRQRKLDRLFGKLDRLAALEPPLTEDEINAEIEAYRQEKRQRKLDNAE